MIDIKTEALLTLSQAAKRLPLGRSGRPVHSSCIFRWSKDGVRTPSGVIRLEAIRLGGRMLTSVEALERFVAAQNPDLSERPPLPRTPLKRQQATKRSQRTLEQVGI